MRSPRIAAALLVAGVLALGPVGAAVAAPLPAQPPAAPLPVQTTAPSKPHYTAPASSKPSATASATPSASPTATATARPTPRPDPEGDRWIQFAIIGGGGLLGAVVFFMIIGSLLRLKYRHQARRIPR